MNPTQQKALALLSDGVSAEQTAAALGVSTSLISQYLSEEEFAGKLATQRFDTLRKHNARDSELDALEDTLIEQLKNQVGYVFDPMKLARLLQVINSAKRRGTLAPQTTQTNTQVVKLNMPITLVQRFTVNAANQVIAAGAQELVTIQSSQMKRLIHEASPANSNAIETTAIEIPVAR